jgi:hypothetical protein
MTSPLGHPFDDTSLSPEKLHRRDATQRRDLADQIAELVRHAVAEEMFVYPAMRKRLPDGEQAVAHDVEEHQELETLMKRLEGADADDGQFLELVQEIQLVLADHVRDEEDEQLPQLLPSPWDAASQCLGCLVWACLLMACSSEDHVAECSAERLSANECLEAGY